MNRTQSEIVVSIEKSAHASGNFNCRQAGIMLDVHQEYAKWEYKSLFDVFASRHLPHLTIKTGDWMFFSQEEQVS